MSRADAVDRYAALPVVGSGPAFRTAGSIPRDRLDEVRAARVGERLDVLLDDGRIVRAVVRHVATEGSGHWSVWLEGFVGSYAAGRARLPGGWHRTKGCRYLSVLDEAVKPTEAVALPKVEDLAVVGRRLESDRVLLLSYRMGDRPVTERCDPEWLLDPRSTLRAASRGRADYLRARTDLEAEAWGRAIVDRFNRTRTEREDERVFVSAKLAPKEGS